MCMGHEGSGLHGGRGNEINGLRNVERWRGNGVSWEVVNGIMRSKRNGYEVAMFAMGLNGWQKVCNGVKWLAEGVSLKGVGRKEGGKHEGWKGDEVEWLG